MILNIYKLQLILWAIPLYFLTTCEHDIEFENNKRALFEFEIANTNNDPLKDIFIQNIVSNNSGSQFSENKIIGDINTDAQGKAVMTTLFPAFYDDNIIHVNGFLSNSQSVFSPSPINKFLSTPVIFNKDQIDGELEKKLPVINLEQAGELTIELNNVNNTNIQVVTEISFDPTVKNFFLENNTLSLDEIRTQQNGSSSFTNQNPDQSKVIGVIIPSTVTFSVQQISNNSVISEETIEIPVTQQEQTFTYDY